MISKRAMQIALGATIARLALASGLFSGAGLGDAEAYYAVWGRTPALGYHDHPPLIGWIAGLASRIPLPEPIAYRLPSILAMLIVTLVAAWLAGHFAGEESSTYAALFTVASPALLVGGIALAPEPAFVMLALCTLLFAALALESSGRRALALGAAAGVSLGLCALCKHSAILLVPPLAFAALRQRRFAIFAVAGSTALLLAFPHMLWLSSHRTTLAYQLGRLATPHPLDGIAKALGGQLLYFGPFVLWIVAAALRAQALRAPIARPGLGLLRDTGAFFGASMLAIMALARDAEPHWPGAAYPMLGIVAACAAPRGYAWRGAVIWTGAATLVAILGVTTPLLKPLIRPPAYDLSDELYGWPRAGKELDRIAARTGAAFLVAPHYTVWAQASLHAKTPVYSAGLRRDASCDLLPEPPRGATALLLVDPRLGRPRVRCRAETKLADLPLWRGAIVARTIGVVRCEGAILERACAR